MWFFASESEKFRSYFAASEPAKFEVICTPICVTASWLRALAVILKHSEQGELRQDLLRHGFVCRKLFADWCVVMVTCVEAGLVHRLFRFVDLSADCPVSDLAMAVANKPFLSFLGGLWISISVLRGMFLLIHVLTYFQVICSSTERTS